MCALPCQASVALGCGPEERWGSSNKAKAFHCDSGGVRILLLLKAQHCLEEDGNLYALRSASSAFHTGKASSPSVRPLSFRMGHVESKQVMHWLSLEVMMSLAHAWLNLHALLSRRMFPRLSSLQTGMRCYIGPWPPLSLKSTSKMWRWTRRQISRQVFWEPHSSVTYGPSVRPAFTAFHRQRYTSSIIFLSSSSTWRSLNQVRWPQLQVVELSRQRSWNWSKRCSSASSYVLSGSKLELA